MNYGSSFYDKQVLNVGVMLASAQPFASPFTAIVKAVGRTQSGSASISFDPTVVNLINANGDTVSLVNANGDTVLCYGMGTDFTKFKSCEGRGKVIAIDYEESDISAPAYVLTGLLVEGQVGASK
jgi:hypothetical protein